MEKGFIENGFIINLSNSKNTNQLVFELSNIMEHPDVKGKRVCLKLGGLDLKQSQLLSIKALIESMDAEIAFIDTVSEQTEASATSLGITVSKMREIHYKNNFANIKFFNNENKEDKTSTIQIMTLHKSKGDEFDYVFIPELRRIACV